MMCLQARQSLPPHFASHHPLRAYAPNSPRAQSRLIVLAMLADGCLDDREINFLERRAVLRDLGIARADFAAVLSDFCCDAAERLPKAGAGFQLTQQSLAGILDEISDPAVRKRLLRHMLLLTISDGRLSPAEKSLLIGAGERWRSSATGGDEC